MKSARLHDKRDIRFEEVSMASVPEAGQVRVKVAYAGICGSDIHNFKTGQWITRKPSIAGHEFSGVIESAGSNVSGFKIGDRVAVDSRIYCGECQNCRSVHQHLCDKLGFIGEAIDGGFAEYITLPARLLVKCKPEARLDVAALAEPLAVALHALAKLNAPKDSPILIVGCGPIGALCAVAADLIDERKLLISDINQDRQAHIFSLTGASPVDLSTFDQFNNQTLKPVRHIIDTTGNVGVISQLISKLSGASLALVGIGQGSFTLNPAHLVEREIALVGCHAFSTELTEAVRMLEIYPNDFAALIGPMISLEQVPAAYEQISAGKAEGIKTMILIDAKT
jgi:(R,R)-butanediol dehydrogenase/meso-butanediol dehydrogenase/diacetyl reductase